MDANDWVDVECPGCGWRTTIRRHALGNGSSCECLTAKPWVYIGEGEAPDPDLRTYANTPHGDPPA